MPLPFKFNWKDPTADDYNRVLAWRVERIQRLREYKGLEKAKRVAGLEAYYAEHPAQFIIDWGMTFDPRNAERGLPSAIPFLLFPRQEEWCEFILRKWRAQEDGITEKSRDMGISWLAVGLASTLCLTHKGLVIGFGSRKEEYVDKIGAPKSLFEKARMFIEMLPSEFKHGWSRTKNAPHMRLMFPHTGSTITGESGDGIGRGDRASMYFTDEEAFLERPQLVEASLSQTTNCRQSMSTPNGMGNPFAAKRHSGKLEVFTFHWRDDPRKGDDWYAKQQELLDPVTLAQEVDIDYAASVEGVVIPSKWVNAAIDAHVKLGIEVTGGQFAALDVADEGTDMNAWGHRYGILLDDLVEWSGKGGDLFKTAQRAQRHTESAGLKVFTYDSDGLGASIRGDVRVSNELRKAAGQKPIQCVPFRGSEGVHKPEKEMVKGRKNKDYFKNLKAQSYWALRLRFKHTYEAIHEGRPFDPAEIISISSKLKLLSKLVGELSQPTYDWNTEGKMIVDKKPEGMASPNLSDVVMMLYNPTIASNGLAFSEAQLQALARS